MSMVKDSEVPSWFIQWNLLSWTELSSMSFFLIVFRDFDFGGMDWFVLCRLREERCSSFQWNGDSTFSPGVCTTVWVGGAVERVREQRERNYFKRGWYMSVICSIVLENILTRLKRRKLTMVSLRRRQNCSEVFFFFFLNIVKNKTLTYVLILLVKRN